MSASRGFSGRWLALLVGTAIAVLAVETTLLALSTDYFEGGYNSLYVGTPGAIAAYLLGGLLLDVTLVLGLWWICLPVLARWARSQLELFCLACLLALAVPGALAIAFYRLHQTLGHLVNASLLNVGSAGSSVGAASMVVDDLPSFAVLALAAAAVGAALVAIRWLAARGAASEAAFTRPRGRSTGLAFLTTAAVAACLLIWSQAHARPLHYGLGHTAGGRLLPLLLDRVTDFDLDGHGLVSAPSDPAAFDPAIHPYAVDLPGNGIDENALGGDHPTGFALDEAWTPTQPPQTTPHLLLIYLESFRADLIGAEHEGREITPALNRLAAEGVHSDHAYVHSPWTLPSRAQLFGGTLDHRPGQSTLIDDFAARGYRTGHISGQDETYGDSIALLGTDRADVFYHARDDLERRTSATTVPVSLQVSWKTVLERASALLDASNPDQPLFLYVNLVDSHFPYDHDELDDILGVERLARHEISVDQPERVFAAYANSAANVDRAAGLLIERWHAFRGGRPGAILVTADHGQTFYETGALGHGQQILDGQTRVPFILWGIGGTWPEPLGASDVRGLLRRHLFAARTQELPRARFEPVADRRLFHYLGSPERPVQIAVRGIDRVVVHDFKQRQSWQLDASENRIAAPPAPEDLHEAIYTWEALAREAAARRR
jgi:hypothetical protein